MKTKYIITLTALFIFGYISAKAQINNIKGDVNEDGVVNAADIVNIVNVIMNGGQGNEPSTTSLSYYVNINITNCERVGERIVVELDIKNISRNTISNLYFSPSSLKDDLSNEYNTYDNIGIRMKGALKRPYEVGPFSFKKDEIKQFEVIAAGFDASNTANSINLVISGTIEGIVLEDKNISASASIVDHRVTDNGIQTNDTGLEWVVKECFRADGNLYVAYNMTNNTGCQLRNITLNEANYMCKGYTFIARDNLAQTYGNLYHTIEGSDNYKYSLSFDLADGETKTIITRIVNFDKSGNATKISINNELKCDSYLFSDPIVRLINIPIQ